MTPRRSLRADVRRRLRAGRSVTRQACPLPDPPSQAGEGKERDPSPANGRSRPSLTGCAGEGPERAWLPPSPTKLQQCDPSLTDAVRALYEESVVPVAQIARLACVAERTLYKYVARGGWRRRYPVRGVEAAAANRGRRRGSRESAHEPQPRGAGGRFVGSGEAELAHASGLKALDPAGALRAQALCREWGLCAGEALARAAALRDAETQARVFALVVRALRDMAALADGAPGRSDRLPQAAKRKPRSARRPRGHVWKPMLVTPLR